MLTREQDSIHANASLDENLSVMVEANECIVYLVQGIFIYYILPNEVTELQKRSKSSNHLRQDMTFDRGKVDLKQCTWEGRQETYQLNTVVGVVLPTPYLHERLGIIPSPLFESMTFRKPTKSWKWRCSHNANPSKVSMHNQSTHTRQAT